MTDAASLSRAVEGQDVVVHLVAMIAGKRQSFERIMEQGTRDLVAAAKDAGVKRFVLMSALGTTEQTKDLVPYYHAKWEMEQTVKASGLEYVIFRPSFVFGREGGTLHVFRRIAKLAPVTPIVGPGTERIQPIWVDDVGAYFAAAIDKPEAANRTFELGGPDTVTWNELWARLKQALGNRRPSIHVPFGLMRVAGRAHREAAERAGHARHADDARRRRQRRHELGRRRHLRAHARPARRAAPAGCRRLTLGHEPGSEATLQGSARPESALADSGHATEETDEGPLSRPFGLRYQLVLAETLPAEAARSNVPP